jgi:chloramphenicol 3-O-phosphotransferase
MLVIIIGHVSSGKTTLLNMLEEHGLNGRQCVVQSIDRITSSYGHYNYKAAFAALEEFGLAASAENAAAAYIRAASAENDASVETSFIYVVESTGSSELLRKAASRWTKHGIEMKVVELWCSKPEFINREMHRTDRLPILSNISSRHAYPLKHHLSVDLKVDTTYMTPNEVLKLVSDYLST